MTHTIGCRIARSHLLASLVAVSVVVPGVVQTQYSLIKTVNFEVQYQQGVMEQDAKKVADFLQSDYDTLRKALGIDLEKRLQVRVYDAVGKFSAQTYRTPSWRGAIYTHGVLHVQPVQALVMRNIFAQSLSFEFALALLDRAGQKGCPQWLREAFASYHSGSAAAMSPPAGVRLASFADLQQDLQTYANPPQRNDVQYILGSTFSYFLKTYGEQKTMGLFKSFDGHTPLEQVVKSCFGQDLGEVERAWASYVRSSPAPAGK